jgi:hypothetical protein
MSLLLQLDEPQDDIAVALAPAHVRSRRAALKPPTLYEAISPLWGPRPGKECFCARRGSEPLHAQRRSLELPCFRYTPVPTRPPPREWRRRKPSLGFLEPPDAARRCLASDDLGQWTQRQGTGSWHWASCLSRRTQKGKAYGVVTAKALAVLEALLWGFHNCRSGSAFQATSESPRRSGRSKTAASSHG